MTEAAVQIPKLRFGTGSLASLPGELSALGVQRPFLMADAGLRRAGLIDRVRSSLGGAVDLYDEVRENPTVEAVDRALAVYRANACDGVIALGGGSVIDTAKGVALVGAYGGAMADHLGRSDAVTRPVAPLITIPTTSGSGSESSPVTGLHPQADEPAIGTRSPFLVSRVAILDPELTVSLPARLTAATGLDALAHCLEAWLSTADVPLVEALCVDGARRVFAALETAVRHPGDLEARGQMMLASFQGGIGIVKGLGPAHALANTFGVQDLHHGSLVALSLGPVLELGEVLRPDRFGELSDVLFGDRCLCVSTRVRELVSAVGLPTSLLTLGFEGADVEALSREAAGSPFNRASPYAPTTEQYRKLVDQCLGLAG